MPPNLISSRAAIFRQVRPNLFVGPEFDPEVFGFAPSAENKNSVSQIFRNGSLRMFQPIIPTVEVYQQNHESFWVANHFFHVV